MDTFLEYALRIIGPKPETIPMARLAAYMAEYAQFLGNKEHVHFHRIVDGSVGIVARVSPEDVALVSPRAREAAAPQSASEGAASFRKLNELLGEDGWTAELPLPKEGMLIHFPGAPRQEDRTIRIVNQPTSVQGRLVRIEGSGDHVRIGLEIDGNLTARITIDAERAKVLAAWFHTFIRISGDGRWKRDGAGRWYLDNLNATSFETLEDQTIGETLETLRDLFPSGVAADVIGSVDEMRRA